MSRAKATVLVLSAFVLIALSPAAAQDWAGRGRLSGQVGDQDGKPIEGARVTLRHVNSPDEGPETLITNKKGRWGHLGLAGGNWTILVEAEGYVPSEGRAHVVEGAIGATQVLRFRLRPIPKEELERAKVSEVLVWIETGNTLLQEGKYAEARAEYERALEKLEDTDKPAVLRGIARTYFQEGNAAQAIATLESALPLKPDDDETLELLITLLVNEGREQEAQKYMAQLPEESKLDPDTLLNMGIKRYNEGKLDEGLEFFDRTVGENPALAPAYYYRGLVHLAKESHALALSDFRKFLELAPDDPKTAEVEQFVEYLQAQVPEDAELDAAGLLQYGIRHYNDENFDQALKFLDRAVAESPELAAAYYYRGLAHMGKESHGPALSDLRKFLELAPEDEKAAEAKQFVEYLESKQ